MFNKVKLQLRLQIFKFHLGIDNPQFVLIITARKRSCGKVIFSVACVKNSVHRGGTWAGTPPRQVHHPGQVHPPEQCMLGDTGNKRAVRIILQCILVQWVFSCFLRSAFTFASPPPPNDRLEPIWPHTKLWFASQLVPVKCRRLSSSSSDDQRNTMETCWFSFSSWSYDIIISAENILQF